MRNFDTGATRDTDEGKIHYRGFLSPYALRRFGQYMEKHRVQIDGNLRAPDNWKKGIPLDAYIDSLLRHTQEFHLLTEEGRMQEAEEVACAMFFNLQGFLHEMTKPVPPLTEAEMEEAYRDELPMDWTV